MYCLINVRRWCLFVDRFLCTAQFALLLLQNRQMTVLFGTEKTARLTSWMRENFRIQRANSAIHYTRKTNQYKQHKQRICYIRFLIRMDLFKEYILWKQTDIHQSTLHTVPHHCVAHTCRFAHFGTLHHCYLWWLKTKINHLVFEHIVFFTSVQFVNLIVFRCRKSCEWACCEPSREKNEKKKNKNHWRPNWKFEN